MICNVGDTETRAHAYKTIEVPEQVDCLQGILTVIPLQLLSLHIAELRNCDVSAYVVIFLFLTHLMASIFSRRLPAMEQHVVCHFLFNVVSPPVSPSCVISCHQY